MEKVNNKISIDLSNLLRFSIGKEEMDFIYAFLFAFFSFFFSLYFFEFYVNGDQVFYTRFYENVSRYGFFGGYIYYNAQLGAREPVFYVLVFLLSPFIQKAVLFSFINAVLGFFLAKGLLRLKMVPILLLPLASNLYLITLYLSAERLKVSLTFFVIALTLRNSKLRNMFLGLSVLSHFQSAILIIPQYSRIISDTMKKLLHGKLYYKSFKLFFLFIAGVGLFVVFQDALLRKISGYSDSYQGITNIINPLIFCLLTVYFRINKKFETVVLHLPIIVAAYFLGDMRMTIFSYFIFMFFAVQYKRGLNFWVLISLIYFSIKGFGFLERVLLYGNGF